MKTIRNWGIAILAGAIGGGLALWAIVGDTSREFERLREQALCVLQLPAGAPSVSASFTTTRTIEGFEVAMRAGTRDDRLSLEFTGRQGPVCSVITGTHRFGCGRDVPPGTYEVTLSQHVGNGGGLAVIAGEKPVFVTGWQVYSRIYVGLMVLCGIVTVATRRAPNARLRLNSAFAFQILLLGFTTMFFYLLFHEGGHALGELMFGRYDFARSDFWGLHGTPHSGGTGDGAALEPWQQVLITGGGALFPNFAGWVLFALWACGAGRRLREARPLFDIFFSSVNLMALFPFLLVPLDLLGAHYDSHVQFVLGHAPVPGWLVRGLLWGMLVVNVAVIWRVAPELWRTGKAHVAAMRSQTA